MYVLAQFIESTHSITKRGDLINESRSEKNPKFQVTFIHLSIGWIYSTLALQL